MSKRQNYESYADGEIRFDKFLMENVCSQCQKFEILQKKSPSFQQVYSCNFLAKLQSTMSGTELAIGAGALLVLMGVANGKGSSSTTSSSSGASSNLSSLYVSASGGAPTTPIGAGNITATGTITANTIMSAGAALDANGLIVGTSLALAPLSGNGFVNASPTSGLSVSGAIYAGSSAAGSGLGWIDASGNISGVNLTVTGTMKGEALLIQSTAAAALAVGANGLTNPAFQVDSSATNAATGLYLTSKAAGSGAILAAISSGANENLLINSKGASAIQFQTANSANPVLTLNQSTAGVTGVALTPAAAASGIALAVTSSGANEALSISGKGTGAVQFQTQYSANPALTIAQSASGVTGLSITPAAAASGVAVSVTSSGTNEAMVLSGKGSGGVTVAGSALTVSQVSSQLVLGGAGATNTVTMSAVTPAASAVVTLRDPKAVAANLMVSTPAGAVTQLTSQTSTVIANGPSGVITMYASTSIAAGASATFTVTNSYVPSASSSVFTSIASFTGGIPIISYSAVTAGTSFAITVANVHATVATSALTFAFLVA